MSTDSIPFTVKWGKKTLTLQVVVEGGVKGMKSELEEQTGVSTERMKLMAKSKGESAHPCPSLGRRFNLTMF